jgi:hypothetical protein
MNNQNLKPFVKGDVRINRKGKPKSFLAWRKLVIDILSEPAEKNGQPIIIDGHVATNAEMIVRSMMGNPRNQQNLLESAFGKVPTPVDVTVKEPVIIKVIHEDK